MGEGVVFGLDLFEVREVEVEVEEMREVRDVVN